MIPCRVCRAHVDADGPGLCTTCCDQACQHSAAAPPEIAPSGPANFAPIVSERVAQFELPRAGRRVSGVEVCYPDGFDPMIHSSQVRGAFAIDSFSQFMDEKGEWDLYVGRALRHVWDVTGCVWMAVYCGGATFLKRKGRVTYLDLLTELPVGLDTIQIISFGNDIYRKGGLPAGLLAAVDEACQAAQARAAGHTVSPGPSENRCGR